MYSSLKCFRAWDAYKCTLEDPSGPHYQSLTMYIREFFVKNPAVRQARNPGERDRLVSDLNTILAVLSIGDIPIISIATFANKIENRKRKIKDIVRLSSIIDGIYEPTGYTSILVLIPLGSKIA